MAGEVASMVGAASMAGEAASVVGAASKAGEVAYMVGAAFMAGDAQYYDAVTGGHSPGYGSFVVAGNNNFFCYHRVDFLLELVSILVTIVSVFVGTNTFLLPPYLSFAGTRG